MNCLRLEFLFYFLIAWNENLFNVDLCVGFNMFMFDLRDLALSIIRYHPFLNRRHPPTFKTQCESTQHKSTSVFQRIFLNQFSWMIRKCVRKSNALNWVPRSLKSLWNISLMIDIYSGDFHRYEWIFIFLLKSSRILFLCFIYTSYTNKNLYKQKENPFSQWIVKFVFLCYFFPEWNW